MKQALPSHFRNFLLEYHDVVINQKEYTFAMVKNAYDLLDKIDPKVFAEDEKMPYWAEIWPGSLVLSGWFLKQHFPLNSTVLEIGSGVGVVSAVLAANGYQATASDYDEDALAFCKFNADITGGSNNLKTQFLDWRKPLLREKFDFIVGSDIIYEVRNILPILDIVRINLKPGGKFYFSDPGRRPMEHLRNLVREVDYRLTVLHSEPFAFRHTNQTVSIYCLDM